MHNRRFVGLIISLIWVEPLKLFSLLNPTNKLNNLTGEKINTDLFSNYHNGAFKKYNIFEKTRADSTPEIGKDNNNILWENGNNIIIQSLWKHAILKRIKFSLLFFQKLEKEIGI